MTARRVCEFFVAGVPVSQGSKGAWVNPATGKAVLMDTNAKSLKPWRMRVASAARDSYSGERVEGAVLMVVEFRFVRPVSVKREFPSVKPDLDKTLRALMDGITDSGIWRDDAQVVAVHMKKVYAEIAGVSVELGEFVPANKTGRRTA